MAETMPERAGVSSIRLGQWWSPAGSFSMVQFYLFRGIIFFISFSCPSIKRKIVPLMCVNVVLECNVPGVWNKSAFTQPAVL